MSLLQLPPETLRLIFEQIGSLFFRQDLNRLTICKQWYAFALPECQSRAMLSDESLKGLFNAQVPERLATLRNNCKVLGLQLGGDFPRSLSLSTQTHGRTSSNQDTNEALRDSPQQDTVARSQSLDNYLVQLALLAHESPKLRSLCIRARGFPPLGLHSSQGDYLSLPTMRSLLSVDNLSVLLLDLTVNFFDSVDYSQASCQLCPTIGTLLGRLQVLQLRVRTICPDALKPRTQSYRLRLSKLVVNLSLATNVAWQTSATHSRRCGSGGGMLQLKTDVQEQAESLVPRITPKMLRILTHSLPSIEPRALDVLTGKIMILDDDVAWDQDGRAPEEPSTPEPELSEAALAAFLNSDKE